MFCPSLFAVAVSVAAVQGAGAEWPFAILRSYGSYEDNPRFTARVFAAQERHPGLIEEIWFCGSGDDFGDPAEQGRIAGERNLGARERCRRLGIAFSFQQGVTLNHGPDGIRRAGFPEDAWAVDREGTAQYGVFCCTSPFVKDYCRRKAEAIMSALHPDSYWPDDDLRMSKFPRAPSSCFCARCLGLFGARVGRTFDREGLLAALTGPEATPELRRAWCVFNGEMLAEYAKVFRAAADAVSPATRIGQQAPYAASTVNGEAWRLVPRAFAGRTGETGVRPGGGYYGDRDPNALIRKGASIAHEAARVSRLPEVKQICYEAENWPHIGALKSPGGMMAECAYMLAIGCDSLALYWGADQNGESDESYDFFFDTFAAWKPFLVGLRDAFRGTHPGGVAAFIGDGAFAGEMWTTLNLWSTAPLVRNGFPVADAGAHPDAYLLDSRAVASLSEADVQKALSRAVLMDVATFTDLVARMPSLELAKKVRIESFDGEKALATSSRKNGYERFRSGQKCEKVTAKIRPLSPDVMQFSEMTVDPRTYGTCVVPTAFGGAVVLVQDLAFAAPGWAGPQDSITGCRRHAILDALDAVTPGRMPVRLLTDGYACAVVARTDADGRTAGAFVMNFGTGETPPLDLALRRGRSKVWMLHRPKADVEPLESVRVDGTETVVRIPPLPPFGVAFVSARP